MSVKNKTAVQAPHLHKQGSRSGKVKDLLRASCFLGPSFLGVLLFFTDWFFGYVILWILFGFAAIARINTLLLERVFRRYEE